MLMPFVQGYFVESLLPMQFCIVEFEKLLYCIIFLKKNCSFYSVLWGTK